MRSTRAKLVLALTCTLTLNGCAQFMAPVKVSEYYSAAERDAFYSMVNRGVVQAAAGVTLLYLVTRLANRPPSEAEMRETWVPRGVRAYIEHRYVETREEQDAWRLTGKATYIATYSRDYNDNPFRPAMELAYFCHMAGGNLQLHAQDRGAFIDPVLQMYMSPQERIWGVTKDPSRRSSKFRPSPEEYRPSGVVAELLWAQEAGAWGYFVCRTPEKKVAWEAVLVPGRHPVPGASRSAYWWKIGVEIDVHETPERPFSEEVYKLVSADNMKKMAHEVVATEKTMQQEQDGIHFEAWPSERQVPYRKDCRYVMTVARFGDRVLNGMQHLVCPDDVKKTLPAS